MKFASQDTHSTLLLRLEVWLVTLLKSFGKHLSSWVLAWLKVKSMGTNVFSLLGGTEKLVTMEESLKKMSYKVSEFLNTNIFKIYFDIFHISVYHNFCNLFSDNY